MVGKLTSSAIVIITVIQHCSKILVNTIRHKKCIRKNMLLIFIGYFTSNLKQRRQ